MWELLGAAAFGFVLGWNVYIVNRYRGIGLALGFASYFAVLLALVRKSEKFTVEWFLDGRRKGLDEDEYIPHGVRTTGAPMSRDDPRMPS